MPFSVAVTLLTASLRRNVTLLRRRMNCSASPISPSRKVRTRGRWSTTVTFVPSRPNIDAYSTPITPAPTTVMLRGSRCWMCSRPSESMIVWSSKATSFGRAGLVPVAMMMLSAVTSLGPMSSSLMQTVCSLTKDAWPNSRPTRLRRNCSRTTCASAPTTRAVRSIRNSIAWRSLPSGLSGSGTSSGRRASSSSTATRRVLEGIVPVWIETPPRRWRRSTTATRLPSLAAWMAAFWPLGPEPMTRRSRSMGRSLTHGSR